MVYSFYDKTSSSSGSDISGLFNPTLHNLGACNDLSSSPHSLVFESDKGELVKCLAAAKVGKSEICEAKALAALKNHSEAERRRRERINAHLATLRGLVPSTEKVCFLFLPFPSFGNFIFYCAWLLITLNYFGFLVSSLHFDCIIGY